MFSQKKHHHCGITNRKTWPSFARRPTKLFWLKTKSTVGFLGFPILQSEKKKPSREDHVPEGISCGSSVAGMTIPETENFTGVAPVPRAVPVPRFAMDQMHQLGRCTPCRFFAFKDDGCHKGDSCTSVCLSQKRNGR